MYWSRHAGLLHEQFEALVAQPFDVRDRQVRGQQRAVALRRGDLPASSAAFCAAICFERFASRDACARPGPTASSTSTSASMHSGGMFWPK